MAKRRSSIKKSYISIITTLEKKKKKWTTLKIYGEFCNLRLLEEITEIIEGVTYNQAIQSSYKSTRNNRAQTPLRLKVIIRGLRGVFTLSSEQGEWGTEGPLLGAEQCRIDNGENQDDSASVLFSLSSKVVLRLERLEQIRLVGNWNPT